MSTEAPRASHPPRPSTPPPAPAAPPRPSHPPRTEEDRAASGASGDAARPGTGALGRTSGGAGAFAPRRPAGPPAGAPPASGPADRPAPGPAAPAAAPPGSPAAGDFSAPRTSGGRPAAPASRHPSAAPAPGRGDTPAAPAAAPAAPAAAPTAPAAAPTTSAADPAHTGSRGPQPRPAPPAGGSTPAAPPPHASARFPDAPPTVGGGLRSPAPPAREADSGDGTRRAAEARSVVPPQPSQRPAEPSSRPRPSSDRTGERPTARRPGAPAETPTETTTRLRPVPAGPSPASASRPAGPGEPRTETRTDRPGRAPGHPHAGPGAPYGFPDPARSWSAPTPPGSTPPAERPVVSFGRPQGHDGPARPRLLGRRPRPHVVAAAVCLVLGVGLIGGAATGSWLTDDSTDTARDGGFSSAASLWHSVPVDELFPPTLDGKGAGPGDADRTWTRIAVAPDSGCKGAFDPLLTEVLRPVGCERLLRATYTDATQSHVTTVGLLFTEADPAGMTSLAARFDKEDLGRRTDLMPLPYAAKGTAAEDFGARQRAAWAVSVLTDAPVVVYAVSGWADGRTVAEPQSAEEAMESGATGAVAQAGLGNEAKGLADRVERGLRGHVRAATERPS
ncbi:hypothetical protein [Streptomyces sp. enrichment culture]|uniref:hypothetical protein n=1 Tax=Streptomyces sp. enrichment culture TaxID=1795815 RepID=UPI003F575996